MGNRNSYLLRSYLDLAGRPDKNNPDASYRSKITSAFHHKDAATYFSEIRRFFSYCLEEVVMQRFLQVDEQKLPLFFQGSFYSRIDAVFADEKSPICHFQCNKSSHHLNIKDVGRMNTPFGFHALVDQHLPLKSGFSLALPGTIQQRSDIKALLVEMSRYDATTEMGNKPLYPLLISGCSDEIITCLTRMAEIVGCEDIDPFVDFSRQCTDRLFGFAQNSLPLFAFGKGLPEPIRSILQPNRDWLMGASTTVNSVVDLLLSLLLDSAARAIHFFHFGLGYEHDVVIGTEDIFAVHGDLLMLDYGQNILPEDQWQGIYLLMQEAMSSMAILENGLVQGYLEAELARMEVTRKVLRKMHHSLSGPISTAFNRFALLQPDLLEKCENSVDRKALGQIYTTLRSAKSQTVSWTAFSNPDRLVENRLLATFDIHELVCYTLKALQLHFSQPWGVVEPCGPWNVRTFLDRGLVEVALWQMLKNAFDHLKISPEGTRGDLPLLILFEEGAEYFSLSVINAGLKCQKSLVTALQKAVFYKMDAPSSKADGQGLGLATCAEIAAAHSGSFTLDVIDSRFCAILTLPIKRS